MPRTKHKGRPTMKDPIPVHQRNQKRTRQTSRSNSGCSSDDELMICNDSTTANQRQKRPRTEALGFSNTAIFDPLTPSLKLKDSTRIYNFGYRKKPAELFRKDLISAMKMADSEQLNESDYITITDHWKEEWEKGVQVPVNPEGLPSASFRLLPDTTQKTVVSKLSPQTSSPIKLEQTIAFRENGNNKQSKNGTKFHKQTKDYIKKDRRTNEFLKYELDLIDICWRNLMNQTCLPKISETVIEDVITELERQCAENMKNNKIGIEFNDGVVCDVCRSPYSEDGNEMIFCDTCNVCVHQACYDIDEIPTGEWYCQPCRELGRVDKACCVLCPNKNGAMKRTPDNHWAHVSCSLWVVSQIDGDHKDNASDIINRSSKKNSKSNKT